VARDLSRSSFLSSAPQWLSVSASSLNRANGAISVECWVNANDFTDDGSGLLYIAAYNVGSGGSNEGWWLLLNRTNSNSLEFGSWDGVDHKAAWGANPGVTWTTGTWHHLTGSWDGTNTWKIYFDGVQKASSTDTQGPCSGANGPFAIGAFYNGTAGRFFFGRVAESTVRNVALTDREVAALAAGVLTRRVRPASIIGYWPLAGLTSPEPDLSGNANNLTLTNSPGAANHAPVTLWTPRSPAFPQFDVAAGDVLMGQACL